MSAADTYAPGEDAKAVSRIAKDCYGGFRQMFGAHGWDAPGDKLMTTAPKLIVEQYGSIRAFEAAHEARYPTKRRVGPRLQCLLYLFLGLVAGDMGHDWLDGGSWPVAAAQYA